MVPSLVVGNCGDAGKQLVEVLSCKSILHQNVFKRAYGIVGHSNIILAEGSALDSSDIDRSPFDSKMHV